jgi:hypothetical protein
MKSIFIAFILVFNFANFAFSQTEGLGELRDIKAPLGLPNNFLLAFIVFGFVVFVLLSIFLWKKYRKSRDSLKKVEKQVLPWELAFKQLKQLESKGLVEKGMFKEYYFQLGLILRYYFENRFAIKAPEMTTEEFLFLLNTSKHLDQSQKKLLQDFFHFSDMVKFAKMAPSIDDALEAYSLVCNLIKITKPKESV